MQVCIIQRNGIFRHKGKGKGEKIIKSLCAALDYSQLPDHQNSLWLPGPSPSLPVAWDRPAATEPGSETVERAALYSANICRQL